MVEQVSAPLEEALRDARVALDVHRTAMERYPNDRELLAVTREAAERARVRIGQVQREARLVAAAPQLLAAVKAAIDWHCSRIGTEAGTVAILWEAYTAAVDIYAPMAGGERCCCDDAPGVDGGSGSAGPACASGA